MERIHAILISLVILVVGGIVIVALLISNKQIEKDRFTVSESGSVFAKADVANINIGIKTEAKQTAAEATQENSMKTNSIIAEIKKLGIEEKNIKTENYNLRPVYDWTQENGQKLKGYEISQNLNIKVKDANKIGIIISKATELGANQIGDITFTIDDETELRNQAREIAIKKAQEKAKNIAASTGMKLGSIKNVVEGVDAPKFAYELKANSLDAATNESAKQPEIQTGQNEIKVNVSLTYEVK